MFEQPFAVRFATPLAPPAHREREQEPAHVGHVLGASKRHARVADAFGLRVLCLAALLVGGVTGSKTCGAQSANWFVDSLGQANAALAALLPELRRQATNPAVREVIGALNQLEIDSSALVTRTRRGESYESVAANYQQLDTRWRDASFRLRTGGEITPSITAELNRIDSVFRTIDRKLGLSPPIDRVRLRDLMIVTLTYMDAMFDDIRLAQGFSAQAESLLSQGRLLRERLRQESYRMEAASFDDIVSSFTEFVRAWRTYAHSLQQLNDPHIHRRLESIRRQGEEVYATLRIQPAPDRSELAFITGRLPAELTALAEQVNRWGADRMTRDQFRFVETCRALAERARRLAMDVQRTGPTPAARTLFTEMHMTWNEGLRLMASVDSRSGLQASLAQVSTHFNEIRDLLGTGSWRSHAELLQVAVALEASAEMFNIDVQRMKRLMEPVAYRNSIGSVSEAFYDSAKELHRQVGQAADERSTSATAQLLVQRWNELTPLINQLPQRGLAPPRSELIMTNYRELQPLVAQAGAMLVN